MIIGDAGYTICEPYMTEEEKKAYVKFLKKKQEKLEISRKEMSKKITAWSINVRWGDGKTYNIDLPDDFRQAHKDINNYLDQLEEEANKEEVCI